MPLIRKGGAEGVCSRTGVITGWENAAALPPVAAGNLKEQHRVLRYGAGKVTASVAETEWINAGPWDSKVQARGNSKSYRLDKNIWIDWTI